MAGLKINGIDSIISDFEKLAKVDDETAYSILEAGAEALRTVWQAVIRRMGLMDPVMPQLIYSLQISRKKGKNGVLVRLGPRGKRKNNKKASKRKKGGTYANTNDEVGYVLEYGSPRIKPRHWMETGNEEGGDACTEAMQEAWNEHLDDLNL